MKKKLLVILAFVVLVSLLFVGCGDKTDQSLVDNSSQDAEDEIEKETEETRSVKESLDIDYENMTEEDLIEELIEDINKITVDEYLTLLESHKYEKDENFKDTLSIKFGKTDKAIIMLEKQDAVFPDKNEVFEKALKSPEPVVRGKALFDLTAPTGEDDNKIKMALDLAKTEEDPYVLNQLASVFRYKTENTEVADFMFKMSKHEHPVIRSTAIVGISSAEGIDGSLERLIEMMDDQDETVSKTAYRRIGYLRENQAIDPLVEVLMDPEKTSYHEDCMHSLVQLWLSPPFYDHQSEKAYNATIEYLKYTPRSKNMPYFKAINYINSVKRENEKDIEDFELWKENATYYNSNDLVGPMFDIVKDSEIYYLACEYAADLVNKYGTKEQFANLKPLIEASEHPEKEKILETYNKIVSKNLGN